MSSPVGFRRASPADAAFVLVGDGDTFTGVMARVQRFADAGARHILVAHPGGAGITAYAVADGGRITGRELDLLPPPRDVTVGS